MTTEDPSFFRSRRNGCFKEYTSIWGSYLAPADDPLSDSDIPEEALKSFEINPDLPKIPNTLWQPWLALCFHYVMQKQTALEVSCRILRSEADPSVYRILVPPQAVNAAHVDIPDFSGSIDIVTGEYVEHYPPPGWIPVGSSHSHNTMTCGFSNVDDASELIDPGLHVIVGSIDVHRMKYVPIASITGHKRRFLVKADAVIDLSTSGGEFKFHPNVLEIIKNDTYTRATTWQYNRSSYRYTQNDLLQLNELSGQRTRRPIWEWEFGDDDSVDLITAEAMSDVADIEDLERFTKDNIRELEQACYALTNDIMAKSPLLEMYAEQAVDMLRSCADAIERYHAGTSPTETTITRSHNGFVY